jgi:hypothetical protein
MAFRRESQTFTRWKKVAYKADDWFWRAILTTVAACNVESLSEGAGATAAAPTAAG